MHAWMCLYMDGHVCGDQRTTFCQLSPLPHGSLNWTRQACWQAFYPLSHLTSPKLNIVKNWFITFIYLCVHVHTITRGNQRTICRSVPLNHCPLLQIFNVLMTSMFLSYKIRSNVRRISKCPYLSTQNVCTTFSTPSGYVNSLCYSGHQTWIWLWAVQLGTWFLILIHLKIQISSNFVFGTIKIFHYMMQSLLSQQRYVLSIRYK